VSRRAPSRRPAWSAAPPASVRELSVVPRRPDGTVDLDACLAALAPALLLESGDDDGWSYVVPTDGPVLRDDGRGPALIAGGRRHELGPDPFTALDRLTAALGLQPGADPDADTGDDERPPFTGGLVGAFAYDLGHRIEVIGHRARRDRPHPDLVLWLADHVLAVSPEGRRAVLVGRPFHLVTASSDAAPRAAAPSRAAGWDARARELAARLARARPADDQHVTARPAPQPVTTSLPADRYLAAVEQVLTRIAAGDVFQVNLTHRLTARWDGDAHALYRALRAESRAAFGACLPALGIASVSPETFLTVAGRTVTTRPIKGTRPRAGDPALDAALADDLATAVKDRAENVMVVDLERNDLGRVCVPGSVEVPQLTAVEGHPTVWHLVSTVRGELRPDIGYGELLRATFPCGSITGAPKVAAMRLIDALEPVRRGWYCGAIGFLSVGAASLSVAIRTATLQPDGRVDYGAGGGIVADSDPHAELAESLDKAVPFLRAVGATGIGPAATEAPRPSDAGRATSDRAGRATSDRAGRATSDRAGRARDRQEVR
jgi:para-aminobenzoate synthetase component I